MPPLRREFLFVTWPGGGNVPPLVALGARLTARGHGVRAIGPPGALEARFAADGMAYVPSLAMARVFGADGSVRRALLRESAEAVRDEARSKRTDALVVDFMQPDALCAGESLGLPTAAFVHTLYARFAVDPAGMQPMNMIGGDADLQTLREDLGLPPVRRTTEILDRAWRVFAIAPRALEGGLMSLPPNLRFAGPIIEAPGADAGWRPPWPNSDMPMIVVSMGTTPMDEAPVLQRILDAASALSAHILVTLPEHIGETALRLPENAAACGFVRHAAVLPHARLFVTHAGLGGIGASVACGVPMLCMPLGRDQPVNAEAVVAAGFGTSVRPDAGVVELRAAFEAALADTACYARARDEAARIRAANPGALLVSELEAL